MSLESPDNTLNVRNAILKVSRVEMNTLSANTVTSNLQVEGDLSLTGTGSLTVPVGTTAQRPATSLSGMVRFNTTTSKLEVYNGTGWTTVGGMSATGGTTTEAGGYRIHTFTTSGTFTVISGGEVEYLVVAGGGGGAGRDVGGGGGAGGMKVVSSYTIIPGTYSITLGAGGSGLPDTGSVTSAAQGNDSSFGSINQCEGGGVGRPHHVNSSSFSNGGSGGGAAGLTNLVGGTGVSDQGNNGGNGEGTASTYYGGGGGGGAGQRGRHVSEGRNGGDGIQSDISGTNIYYAGGGGGAGHRTSGNTSLGSGGLGGGGDAGTSGTTSTRDGTDGLGGGGASRNEGLTGGAGGDGIVIIRYLL